MSLKRPICLKFGPDVSSSVQSRLRYVFQVFAAVYGHLVVGTEDINEAICFTYGFPSPSTFSSSHIAIPARFQTRTRAEPSPHLVKHCFAHEDFYLFFGVDETTGQPDWLAEIFEWLSSSHEISSCQRDSIGRIPFSETLFARQQLSPRKPYALMMMAWLEGVLQNGPTSESLPRPPSPVPGTEHLVVCSHDIDFYFTDTTSALVRLLKNLVIAIHIYRSWDFFRWNAARIPRLLRGHRLGAYLPALLKECRAHDFESTLFVVSNHLHRRDPNYALQQLVPVLTQSLKGGFSIGIHGSYQSIIERADLKSEVEIILEALGSRPLGSRQHYLRFDHHDSLFSAIEQAGLCFDSTLGFTDTVGFRNGASFAFPPYDFRRECAYDFLEIPLIVMDGGLEAACRSTGEHPAYVADEVLRASRKWGWGGVALDWHNPIEPIQVPSAVNDAFWQCLKQKTHHHERWMSGDRFLRASLNRYHAAGLLQGVRIDA